MEEIKRDDHIWVFNAGDAFSGNPKWLFLYVQNHRPDIKTYWLCYKKELVTYMRKRGYRAYLYDSHAGRKIERSAGVYVVDQVKEIIQDELKGIKILNLWHGVGCKTVEREVNFGYLDERIATKYITNNFYYKNYMMFLVTSPLMEKHFIKNIGLNENQLIRAGYPRCFNQEHVESYDHNLRKRQGLSSDAKVIVYSPTYRDFSPTQFFSKAVPDMGRLAEVAEKKNLLFIFKMHPLMIKDPAYQEAVRYYEGNKHFLFWDNADDIYEVFDQIDAAIVDYSSIFYDFLAAGIKHFIRYQFDIDVPNNLRDFVFDVKEMTCGYSCNSFAELTETLAEYEVRVEKEDPRQEQLFDLFWSYASKAGNAEIVDQIMAFTPEPKKLPTLYSFDIFDTLFTRRTLSPEGIFHEVKDRMAQDTARFPNLMLTDFPRIRHQVELNTRQYHNRTLSLRKDGRREITLDEIYARMQATYQLSDEQIARMKELELQSELNNVIPRTTDIQKLKKLLADGNKVLLISDMYLPEEWVRKMLTKADPVLATVPLYLSSTYGVQKTTRKLFLKAYHDLDYDFGTWIHYGDSRNADEKQPRRLGIQTVHHDTPSFNEHEENLVESLNSYDGYLAAATMERFRTTNPELSVKEQFAYSYASLFFVPYVHWTLKNALSRGIQTLYFISRDGYHLKEIADALIKLKKYPLQTKYIYGSRKAWRVPSQIHEIDEEFFSEFGNFAGIKRYDDLLTAMDLDEAKFNELFPQLSYLKDGSAITGKQLSELRSEFSDSPDYRSYLLETAKRERELVIPYLQQEIDFDEKFAFVEYWGRGYTQTCLARLIDEAAGDELTNLCYYSRSIYGSRGKVLRQNYTTNTGSQLVIEALFANLPYKSVAEYQQESDGTITPVILPRKNDDELHKAFSRYLPQFAHDLYSQPLQDSDRMDRELFNFAMDYYSRRSTSPIVANSVGPLKDSVSQYGIEQEFAPKITFRTFFERTVLKKDIRTRSEWMTLARSSRFYQRLIGFIRNRLHRPFMFGGF